MLLCSGAQELSPFSALHHHQTNPLLTPIYNPLPMRTSLFYPLSLLRSCTLSLHHQHHRHHHLLDRRRFLRSLPAILFQTHQEFRPFPSLQCASTFVEPLAHKSEEKSDFSSESDFFEFDKNEDMGFVAASGDVKHLNAPGLEIRELDELPEQWRRAKLAWLCKELPAHKSGTLVGILNAQRKWMRQEDATYVAVHCTRIRENEAGFKVYKWMMQQRWYRFDFALATKLADYMGKERKFSKCREIFDDIINQGRVPSESTFHILVVAYLSTRVQGCLEEACAIYNRMIQLGGYRPRLSLHNSLFRALLSKPGGIAKTYLKQAEFIYHNLVTSGLEIQKDIYAGLIWLHSYQDSIDKDRIASLREEMKQARVEEGKEVLVSILRACSKEGDVEEAERTWLKLRHLDSSLPSQAFVYRMEVYAKVGEPLKSLEVFREMKELLGSASVAAYHKVIAVLCETQEIELAELIMQEFTENDMKPLMPAYIDLMSMYLNLSLHDKLESAFSECLEKCRSNRNVYNLYLDSLVKVGNLEKAEEMFNHMFSNEMVGVNARSCNAILSGYLSSGDNVKAEKIYDLMCKKKYDIEPSLMEKLEIILSSRRKKVEKPVSISLSKEQREMLVGMLLGGLRIESDEKRKKHVIHFEFNPNSGMHSALRRHLYDQYHEWLHPSCKPSDDSSDIPYRFSTIPHSYFGFYADQFWAGGHPVVPKLIHRWLSSRALAYWYMYGGHQTSSGDILLKLKGSTEGAEKVVKSLRAKSLNFRVKRKGRVFWIGFLGGNSTWFRKLIEPYVLDDSKEFGNVGGRSLENVSEDRSINFDSSDEAEASEYSDIENS